MKIAVIFTGGTIGSQMGTDGWIAPNQEQPFALLEKYKKEYEAEYSSVEFDCMMPYQILSENLDATHLMLLIETVQKLLQKGKYDSLIICHGTDTLQYTAAILDYVFAQSETPIFLVSSNYPIEDSRANGLVNFHYAVVSSLKNWKGVFVIYRNSDGNIYVHRGSRLLAHQTFEDDLFSLHHENIGWYNVNGEWNEGTGLCASTEPIPYCGLRQVTDSILWIKAYPGMSYPTISKEIQAVLLESYHSGTVAICPELERFAKDAKEKGVPIFLVGAVSGNSGYETIRHYDWFDFRVLENQAPIGVYCRLWLELSADIKGQKSDDKRK